MCFTIELLRDGFGKHPLFHCVIAEERVENIEGTVLGHFSFFSSVTRTREYWETISLTSICWRLYSEVDVELYES